MPFPLLLLTAFLVILSTALVAGVRRDILANRASPAPERIGLGIVAPLVLAGVFIVGVEITAFRFWEYLVATGVP